MAPLWYVVYQRGARYAILVASHNATGMAAVSVFFFLPLFVALQASLAIILADLLSAAIETPKSEIQANAVKSSIRPSLS